MDWNQIIITLITMLIPTGGICTIVTLKDKKYEAFLNNVSKLNEEWKAIAQERANRNSELKADLDKKDAIIEKKDKKIDSLHSEQGSIRQELDSANTRAAVLEVTHCHKIACSDREPPFGSTVCAKCGDNLNHNKSSK